MMTTHEVQEVYDQEVYDLLRFLSDDEVPTEADNYEYCAEADNYECCSKQSIEKAIHLLDESIENQFGAAAAAAAASVLCAAGKKRKKSRQPFARGLADRTGPNGIAESHPLHPLTARARSNAPRSDSSNRIQNSLNSRAAKVRRMSGAAPVPDTTSSYRSSNCADDQVPNGWSIKCVPRKSRKTMRDTKKIKHRFDFYFTTPNGEGLRSIKGCQKWCIGHTCSDTTTIIQQLKKITKALRLKHK